MKWFYVLIDKEADRTILHSALNHNVRGYQELTCYLPVYPGWHYPGQPLVFPTSLLSLQAETLQAHWSGFKVIFAQK